MALSLNNNEVRIYEHKGTEYTLIDSLKGHDLLVTGIDWAPTTNRIVTCAAVSLFLSKSPTERLLSLPYLLSKSCVIHVFSLCANRDRAKFI